MTTEIKALFRDPCLSLYPALLAVDRTSGWILYYGAFTLAIFAAILAAISNRPCKLLAILQRFESPVVYTSDRFEIAAKIILSELEPPPSARDI